jgi:uncharacterized protein YaaQ
MKLTVCVVHGRDKNRLTEALIKSGYKFTIIGSTGGFLREGNTTMLIGVEDDQVDALAEILRANCQTREQVVNVMPFESGAPGAYLASPVKVPVGGAVMFVLPVDAFHRF